MTRIVHIAMVTTMAVYLIGWLIVTGLNHI